MTDHKTFHTWRESMNSTISYITGDATLPQSQEKTIIVHICNDIGVFGAGFVVAIGKRYPIAKTSYLGWAKAGNLGGVKFELGEVQFVKINDTLWVANMIAQKGIGFRNGPPIRYEALDAALEKVANFAKNEKALVMGPRFGSGLAGGNWEVIEAMIIKKLCKQNIPVIICDLAEN